MMEQLNPRSRRDAYGSKINTTPHIDQLAKEGMRLDRCFVTNSICTPSRAAILTGKYSHKNGVPVFNRFDGSQQTVAKLLQSAGYHTGMFGKWHLGHHPEFLPTEQGFDEFYGIPYSHDMWPNHPVTKNYYPELPLIE